MSDGSARGLTGKTGVMAVFGCPVEHSLSPAMHNAAIQALGIDFVYVPFRVEPEMLPQAVDGVRAMRFAGVNLTIPLKERAVELVDELSQTAKRIGSVNTLWWDGGKLMGESTDGPGFLSSLEAEVTVLPKQALILGAGGSARAVCFALAQRGVKLVIANRTSERAEKLASEVVEGGVTIIPMTSESLKEASEEVDLIVNCTSVGMTPNIQESPLDEKCVDSRHTVYDLVYNPAETRLLSIAREKGAKAINGLKMLVHQGAYSFKLWTGIDPPLDVMEQAISGGLK